MWDLSGQGNKSLLLSSAADGADTPVSDIICV